MHYTDLNPSCQRGFEIFFMEDNYHLNQIVRIDLAAVGRRPACKSSSHGISAGRQPAEVSLPLWMMSPGALSANFPEAFAAKSSVKALPRMPAGQQVSGAKASGMACSHKAAGRCRADRSGGLAPRADAPSAPGADGASCHDERAAWDRSLDRGRLVCDLQATCPRFPAEAAR